MKKTIILVVTLLIGLNSFGQKKIDKFDRSLYHGKYTNKEFFNKAEFIFEAEIISTKSYTNKDTTKVYASSVMKISHIYKGEIDADTIEFVRNGGEFLSEDGRHIIFKEYIGQLYLSSEMIIFAKKREGRTFYENYNVKLEPFENSRNVALYYSDDSDYNFVLFGLDNLYFKTFSAFQKYAKEQMDDKDSFHPKKKITLEDCLEEDKVKPRVTAFTPRTLNAGVGDTLYIYGENFGSTQGEVWFRNADNGGTSFIEGSDGYIKYWSNTEIRVTVPSQVKNNTDKDFYPAGTGKFKVVTANGKKAKSPRRLTIGYALMNVGIPDSMSDYRLYLVKNKNKNGLVFTLHSNVVSNSGAVICIERALLAWSNYLCFELSLERDSNGNYVTVNSGDIAGKNVILYNPAWKNGMYTIENNNLCCPDSINNRRYWYRESKSDIGYGQLGNTPWSYKTSGSVSSGSASFYNAFLHEVGHVLGLDHVIAPRELMYYEIDTNSSQQIFVFPPQGNLKNGIDRVVDDSYNILWADCPYLETMDTMPEINYFAIDSGNANTRYSNVELNNDCNISPDCYMVSENQNFENAHWEVYDKAPIYEFNSYGLKKVYFKVRGYGRESVTAYDYINYQCMVDLDWIDIKNSNGRFAEPNTSVNTISENDITVYPVPFSDYINIIVPANQQDNYKLKITDVNGRVILTTHITTKEKRINLSNLSKGIYFVTVIGNENIFYKKIVKQ